MRTSEALKHNSKLALDSPVSAFTAHQSAQLNRMRTQLTGWRTIDADAKTYAADIGSVLDNLSVLLDPPASVPSHATVNESNTLSNPVIHSSDVEAGSMSRTNGDGGLVADSPHGPNNTNNTYNDPTNSDGINSSISRNTNSSDLTTKPTSVSSESLHSPDSKTNSNSSNPSITPISGSPVSVMNTASTSIAPLQQESVSLSTESNRTPTTNMSSDFRAQRSPDMTPSVAVARTPSVPVTSDDSGKQVIHEREKSDSKIEGKRISVEAPISSSLSSLQPSTDTDARATSQGVTSATMNSASFPTLVGADVSTPATITLSSTSPSFSEAEEETLTMPVNEIKLERSQTTSSCPSLSLSCIPPQTVSECPSQLHSPASDSMVNIPRSPAALTIPTDLNYSDTLPDTLSITSSSCGGHREAPVRETGSSDIKFESHDTLSTPLVQECKELKEKDESSLRISQLPASEVPTASSLPDDSVDFTSHGAQQASVSPVPSQDLLDQKVAPQAPSESVPKPVSSSSTSIDPFHSPHLYNPDAPVVVPTHPPGLADTEIEREADATCLDNLDLGSSANTDKQGRSGSSTTHNRGVRRVRVVIFGGQCL